MIAETLFLLLGHKSSLFPTDQHIDPAFVPLLHPGERQCLESLGLIAWRYRQIKASTTILSQSNSRYMAALCARLNRILADEYETLVVSTEAKILQRDSSLVGSGSFVPLSSLRATFAEWDAPFAALLTLTEELSSAPDWKPGPLIDLLLRRSRSGVQKVSRILTELSQAVQQVWMTKLAAFLLHSSASVTSDSFADATYKLRDGSVPSVVSAQSRDSIAYIGKALGTAKDAEGQRQMPRPLVAGYVKLLESVLPERQHEFDRVIAEIRASVGEWLWLNVLTKADVDAAVDSLADYLLLRNGEFGLALIHEIEQLKLSRLIARVTPSSMIREQDLHLALLRASLGTSAQHDPSLNNLRCHLPSGAVRPLLPSLDDTKQRSKASHSALVDELTTFDDLLLGMPMVMTYDVRWPLDLFLQPADLKIYGALFSYLTSLRKTHSRVHACWASLSNAQRARRRWTGLSEGGTAEDISSRKELSRCGWGVVRQMGWFIDTLLEYLMNDVVDAEFKRLKTLLSDSGVGQHGKQSGSSQPTARPIDANGPSYLDFTTLRVLHAEYLGRLLTSSLLLNAEIASIVRHIIEVCEGLVAQVERWGGDILPDLLSEGSLASRGEHSDDVGSLVQARSKIVADINSSLQSLLRAFYDNLTASMSQQTTVGGTDASRSLYQNRSVADALSGFQTTFIAAKIGGRNLATEGDVRRRVERLLLRLDFNSEFSKPLLAESRSRTASGVHGENILKEGGLA